MGKVRDPVSLCWASQKGQPSPFLVKDGLYYHRLISHGKRLGIAAVGFDRAVQGGFGYLQHPADVHNGVSFLVEIPGNSQLPASQGFGSTAFSPSGCGNTCCCSYVAKEAGRGKSSAP
jgi:hypothetical protein